MPVQRFELSSNGLVAARTCLDQHTPATDAERIRAIAARSAAFAGELRRVQHALVDGMDWQLWTGKARDAFHAKLLNNAPVLVHTIERYESYAGALNSYACTLEWVGPTLQRTQSELRWGIAAAEQSGAAHPVIAGPVGPPYPELLEPARRFKTAYDDWAGALDRCSAALLRANSSDPLHAPHGLAVLRRKLASFIDPVCSLITHPTSAKAWSDALSSIGNSLTMIGICLLPFCPVVAAAVLAAAAVVGTMQLAVDSYRKFVAGDATVSWWSIGMDAVSSLPFGAVARGAKVAGELGAVALKSGPRLADGMAFAWAFSATVKYAAVGELAALIRPMTSGAKRVPSDLFRSSHHGGWAALPQRWARPVLWDAPNAVLQWPTRKDQRGTPQRTFDSATTSFRRFEAGLMRSIQHPVIRSGP